MTTKRYFWLKLKEDFFGDRAIKALRRLPQGDSLTIVYLKMQLISLKTSGVIRYEHILPDSVAELAMAMDEDENVVRLAVEALIRFGVVERWEDETLFMVAMQQLIGSETSGAARMRKLREQKKSAALPAPSASHCDTHVQNRDGEIEIEIEIEKEIDIEIEKEKDIGAAAAPPAPAPAGEKDKKPVKHKHGEYKNVLLTDEELEKLRGLFPTDLQERIERLSEYIASSGKTYKSHYATIRSWANRDKKQAPRPAARRGHHPGPVGPNGIAIDPTKTDLDGLFR